MGNTSEIHSFENDDFWKVIAQTKHGSVIINLAGQEAEIFKVPISSENQKKIIQTYWKRKTKPSYMVRVLDYYPTTTFTCSSCSTYIVLTQKLIRFSDFEQMDKQTGIATIKQVLILYQNLESIFGPFQIQSEMIGKSKEGYIKLWINQNFGKNQPSYEYQSSKEQGIAVAKRICKIVSTKVKYGKSLRTLFNDRKYQNFSISKIIKVLSDMQIHKNIPKNNSIQIDKNIQTNHQMKSKISNFTFNPANYNENFWAQRKNQYFERYLGDIFKINNDWSRPVSNFSNNRVSMELPHYIHSFQSVNKTPTIIPNIKQLTLLNQPQKHKLQLFFNNQNTLKSKLASLPIQQPPTHQQCTLPSTTNSCANQSIYEFPNIINSTLKNIDFKYPITMTNTDVTIKPFRETPITKNQQIDEMRLINSHIFVTNQDLYSDFDNILKRQIVKIEESTVVRRLSQKGYKID